MLSKSFKPNKCKTSLKLAMARIKLLRNKRDAQLKQMKRDLSLLLESGQHKTAMIRVEHVVREENTIAAYDIVELFCELIVARLPIIESQKNCPIDLKEAISSVIFASPRCADIPELLDVRKHFVAKYGKEFVASALELRPDCGVNRTIIEKLSVRAPDGETKIKILTAIAHEHNVKWNPEALEEKSSEPPEDLLNGPSKVVSASKMDVESPNVRFPPPTSQKHEPDTKLSAHDVNRSPPSSKSFADIGNPTASMPTSSSPEPRVSDHRMEEESLRNSSFKNKNSSLNRKNWNMEFKDATSAAQAAAESAERASMAARAAAELSSCGKGTRENSTEQDEWSVYHMRVGRPGKHTDLKLKGEAVPENSVKTENYSRRNSFGKDRMQTQHIDESEEDYPEEDSLHEPGEFRRDDQRRSSTRYPSSESGITSIDDSISVAKIQNADGFSRKISSELEARNQNQHNKNAEMDDYLGKGRVEKQSSQFASSHRKSSFDDEISGFSHRKVDAYSQKGFSSADSVIHDWQSKKTEKGDLGFGSIKKQSSKSAHPHSTMSTYGDDVILETNIQKYEYDADEHRSISSGQRNTQQGSKESSLTDKSAAVFDESDSDGDSYLELESDHNGNAYNSYFQPEIRKSPSHFSSNTGKDAVFSQSNEFVTTTFDDSEDLSSESEEEANTFKIRERRESIRLSHKHKASTRSPPPDLTDHEPAESPIHEKKEAQFSKRDTWSHASSDSDSDEPSVKINQESEANVGESWKKYGTGNLPNNQASPKHTKDTRKSNLDRESFGSQMIEEPKLLQSRRLPSTKEVKAKDKFGATSSPDITKDSEISNYSSNESEHGNEHELSLGRLMGGFRNKGFSRPPYVRGPFGDAPLPLKQQKAHDTHVVIEEEAAFPSDKTLANSEACDASLLSKQQTGHDTPILIEKSSVSKLSKTSGSSEAHDQALHNQKTRIEVNHESSLKAHKTYFDSDSDNGEEVPSNQIVGTRGHKSVRVSRRTRDSALSRSEVGSASRFSGRSEVTVTSDFDMRNKPSRPTSSLGEPVSKPRTPVVNNEKTQKLKPLSTNLSVTQPFKPLPESEISVLEESSKSSQPSTVEKLSMHQTRTAVSGVKENTKSTSLNENPTSTENSLKSASHVHPKLPDYDSFAAHFASLRSNQRQL